MDPIALFKGLSRLWQAVVLIIMVLAAIWVLTFVRGLLVGSADVEAKLGTNQADAAIESGQDAVETVGDNQDAAVGTQDKVKGIQDEVNQASDGAGADSAARDGLCQQFGLGCKE